MLNKYKDEEIIFCKKYNFKSKNNGKTMIIMNSVVRSQSNSIFC